jgi:hypothetical protein
LQRSLTVIVRTRGATFAEKIGVVAALTRGARARILAANQGSVGTRRLRALQTWRASGILSGRTLAPRFNATEKRTRKVETVLSSGDTRVGQRTLVNVAAKEGSAIDNRCVAGVAGTQTGTGRVAGNGQVAASVDTTNTTGSSTGIGTTIGRHPFKADIAGAAKRSSGIGTSRIETTDARNGETFIDVGAGLGGRSTGTIVPGAARAGKGSWCVGANGIGTAIERVAFINVFANTRWRILPNVTSIALTSVATGSILAHTVGTANGPIQGAFVDVDATPGRGGIASVSFGAFAIERTGRVFAHCIGGTIVEGWSGAFVNVDAARRTFDGCATEPRFAQALVIRAKGIGAALG